jgi:DNA-binding MarR family transcriptional regulator
VARQLEKEWEAALAERQRLGEEYDRFTASRPRALTPAERSQIRALAEDIPAIWHAPTTTDADRKQLIRHLAGQVQVEVLGTTEKVKVHVVWAGGHRTTAQISRPVASLNQLSYYPQLAKRACELAAAGLTHAQIAAQLTTEGFRPPKRCEAFTAAAVSDLLRAAGAQLPRSPARRPALAEHEWWLRDLAAHLGMSHITLDSWVRRGWAAGYLHPAIKRIVVRADPAEVERLRILHQTPRGQHVRRPWLKNQEASINSAEEGASENADKPQV